MSVDLPAEVAGESPPEEEPPASEFAGDPSAAERGDTLGRRTRLLVRLIAVAVLAAGGLAVALSQQDRPAPRAAPAQQTPPFPASRQPKPLGQ